MEHSDVITFENWLAKHRKRMSPLGHLASDVGIDSDWPTGTGVASYRAYLDRINVQDAVKEAFEKAWKSYTAFLRRKGHAIPKLPDTFENWLAKYRREDSPVGDLANDVARDHEWPTGAGIEVYRARVSHGCSGALEALNRVWKSYQAHLARAKH
jgi:uncharacterized protein YozE (UPF0346 family)